MPTVDIPFPLSSAPGRSPGEGAGRLINCYAEALGPEAISPAVRRRVAGLTAFSSPGGAVAACRGFLEVNGLLYAVIGRTMYAIASDGGFTIVGVVAGTKKVFMARNNKKPNPDKVLVTENGAFSFDTTIVAFADPNLPVPCGVCFQDGFFFFPVGDGRCFATGVNDVTVNALTFSTAESKPDGLVTAIPFNNQLLLFGSYSLEFWSNTSNAFPAFPYTRSAAVSRGLVASTAIAGHQDGFGGSALIWVADDNTVVKLDGYTPVKISAPDLDNLIELVADKTTLEACVYIAGGHPKWVLSSNDWTWEFDLNTQKWNERASYGLARWRASQAVYAFGKWLAGDTQTGSIFQIDAAQQKEGTNALIYRLESGPAQNFPNRTRVARADFDLASGVGDATGATVPETDPVAEVSWSDDGGATWSLPVQRPLGQQGRYRQRITVTGSGSSGPRGRRWRIVISDPAYAAITLGRQSTELRDH
jgi:hypothetical protein